jgi:hypothetical protein
MAVSACESQSFSGEPTGWENLDLAERERRSRAIQAMERSRAQTPVGLERAFNRAMREFGFQEPTRAQLRAERKQIRNQVPKLTPQRIDRNAYRHKVGRERCPRDMPARRPDGWTAIHFVLPRRTIEGLTLLTKAIAARERAERSDEPHGFQRRYSKTKNFFVVKALNCLLEEHGLSQFCVEEVEPEPGRVRRFAVPTV